MHVCMYGWMDGWMDGCMYVLFCHIPQCSATNLIRLQLPTSLIFFIGRTHVYTATAILGVILTFWQFTYKTCSHNRKENQFHWNERAREAGYPKDQRNSNLLVLGLLDISLSEAISFSHSLNLDSEAISFRCMPRTIRIVLFEIGGWKICSY